jgi:hypothetical protein
MSKYEKAKALIKRREGRYPVGGTSKKLPSFKRTKGQTLAGARIGRMLAGARTKTGAGRKTVYGAGTSGPGRPRQTYKPRINPFTGKRIAIPATQYYKLIKKFRRIQQARAQQTSEVVDTRQVRELAKRGIPPEQAKQIVDQRQLLQATRAPVPQREVPTGYHRMPSGNLMRNGRHRGPPAPTFKVVTDIMTGRKRIVPVPRRERWTYE